MRSVSTIIYDVIYEETLPIKVDAHTGLILEKSISELFFNYFFYHKYSYWSKGDRLK